MERIALDLDQVHPSIQSVYNSYHAEIVQQVRDAVSRNAVVVVGMATNPHVKEARKLLTEQGIEHLYLEYGGYTSKWKERLAIKMWSGWPTFPQVFVHGKLIGGASDARKLADSGELKTLVQAGRG